MSKKKIGSHFKPMPLWLKNIMKNVEKQKEYNEKRSWYRLVYLLKKK